VIAGLLESIAASPVVRVLEIFAAAFPVVMALLAIDSSRQFHLDRRGIVTRRLEPSRDDLAAARDTWPGVTVIIPARNEEHTLADTLDAALHLRWPDVEVIVVDDGSTDATRTVVEHIAARLHQRGESHRRITVIAKDRAEGKSRALNDAIARTDNELVLILDADTSVAEDIVELMATQLHHHPDMGAVAANVRVLDTARLLQKLQAIEFSATVSTQRRGHAAWGRISTISGACALLRRSALIDVGGFDPTQPAEDIELTWRMQTRGWRVGYEPQALVGTFMPTTMRGWFKQRTRWARGLVNALRTNGRAALREFRMWPLLAEAVLSIVWCHVIVALTALWVVCVAAGVPVVGNSLLIGRWGALTILVSIGQILWGIRLDRADDPTITRVWPYAPLFPLAYWWMSAIVVAVTTVPTLLRPSRHEVAWTAADPRLEHH
jgi:biofilm PGA synthesis N-glycosyltransferase PgaC